MKFKFFVLVSLIFFISCKGNKPALHSSTQSDNIFKHAKLIYSKPGSNKVTIYYTWNKHRDSITYTLSKEKNTSKTKNQIQIPISNVAVISTTDIAMIDALKKNHTISGVSDPARITNAKILELLQSNKIKNLGIGLDVNQELLLALHPNIVVTSAYSSSDFERNATIHSLHIPIIYTMSWQESSPLARAEWIKLFGLLYDMPTVTDSIFSVIETNYLALQQKTKSITNKPTILAGDSYKDIWYMPGGKSYIAQFIRDAGGTYIWNSNTETGSFPVNFEQVIQKTPENAFWIGADEYTYEELLRTNKNYKFLSVFKNKQIYNRNKCKKPSGANDYWESGFIRPDVVLADFITIIHPEILPNRELVYYQKLK